MDEILVRTLYNPRITAGMAPKSALTKAREIIIDLDQKLP